MKNNRILCILSLLPLDCRYALNYGLNMVRSNNKSGRFSIIFPFACFFSARLLQHNHFITFSNDHHAKCSMHFLLTAFTHHNSNCASSAEKKNIIHQVLKIMKKKITATIYPFWIIHFCGIENQHLHQSNRLDVWEMNNCHAFTFVVKPVKYTEVAKCLCISVTIYSRSSNIWNKKTTSTNIGKIP